MANIKLFCPNFIEFKRSQQQIEIIKSGLEQFGTTTVGLARILSRVHVKKIYRIAEIKKL